MDAVLQLTTTQGLEESLRGLGQIVRNSLDAFLGPLHKQSGEARHVIYTREGLGAVGDKLIRDAQARQLALSMAVLDFKDLLEAQLVYDKPTFEQMVERVMARLAMLAGSRGVIAHTGPAEFTVVLPGMDRRRATRAIDRTLGRPACIEFDNGEIEVLLVPDIEVECAGPDIEYAQQFYEELRLDLDEAHEYERQRLAYIAREREWHSRPMGLHSESSQQSESTQNSEPCPQQLSMPSTMAAPLLRH